MRNLADKTAVVTGAASGIGRELCTLLADEGCNLAILDIDEKGLKEVETIARNKGRIVSAHLVDVSEENSMKRFSEEVVKIHGNPHILVNNAGVQVFDTLKDGKTEDFEWILGINLWGTYYGCKYFLPYLSQVKKAAIVNVSSAFGFIGLPTQAFYCASKFAVRGLTESLRLDLAESNPDIHVCLVHPGTVDTNIVRNCRFFAKTIMGDTKEELTDNLVKVAKTKPKSAAKAILSGIKKNRKRVRIGIDSVVVDIVQRLFPVSYPAIVTKFFSK